MRGWRAPDYADFVALGSCFDHQSRQCVGVITRHFISFEGGEGAGKSTQLKRLAKRLTGLGHHVVVTREPGGSTGAESIRDLLVNGPVERWSPMTETLLMYASRRDHLERVIEPALAKGSVVLCDRFHDSTRAYQGAGGGVSEDFILALEQACLDKIRPSLTLILDLPVGEGLARAAGRGEMEARFEAKGEAFHARLRSGFLAIAKAEPDRCCVIDAAQSMDAVEAAIWQRVQAHLAAGRS
jgi:dTMP kinase